MLSRPSIDFLKQEIIPLLGAHRGQIARSLGLILATPMALLGSLELARRSLAQIIQPHPASYAFARSGALALLSLFAGYALMFLRDRRLDILAARIIAELRTRGFAVAVHMNPMAGEQFSVGQLVKRLVSDTAEVRTLLMQGVLLRVADAIMVITFVVYAFVLNPEMAAVSIGVVLAFFAFARWTAVSARTRLRVSDRDNESFTSAVEEAFRRWEDVHGGHTHDFEVARVSRAATALEASTVQAHRWLLIDKVGTTAISGAGPLLVLLLGGAKIVAGDLNVDELAAFIGITTVLYKPANELSALPMLLQRSTIAVENLRELFSSGRENKVEPHVSSRTLAQPARGGLALTDAVACVGRWSLRIPEFHLNAGDRIALCGPSGAGKSTLLRVIHGQLPLTSGGSALSEDLRQKGRIRLLPQTSLPFTGSLLENVQLWTRSRTASDEASRRVLDLFGLAGELDDAASRPLRPDGAGLSGGQLRRVLLARASLSDAAVLLLDEPMTGIDLKRRRDMLAALLAHLGREVCVVASTHEPELAALFTRRYRIDRVNELESVVLLEE